MRSFFTVQCILPQNQTTPERILSNPWHGKSIFEPGQYKSAIDRCEGGYKSCELAIDMLKDFMEIEEKRAKTIRHWSEKYQTNIHQSKDFGTNKRSWLEVVRAMELMAQQSEDLVKGLREGVLEKFSAYKNNDYGRSFLHIKKVKEFDKQFRKVQKPWTELNEKVTTAKQTYTESRRKLRSAECAAKMVETDAGSTPEDQKKAKSSVEKYSKVTDIAKQKYENAVGDVKTAKPQYEKSMTEILDQTHDFERSRLKKFNETFQSIRQLLAVEKVSNYQQIHQAFQTALQGHDIEADIKYWNESYGSASKVPWPTLETVVE